MSAYLISINSAQRHQLDKLKDNFLKLLSSSSEARQNYVQKTSTRAGGNECTPMYYYYKRWLWLMFPWVCLSPGLFFSKIMQACFSSDTKYMSVKKEREYTQRKIIYLVMTKHINALIRGT